MGLGSLIRRIQRGWLDRAPRAPLTPVQLAELVMREATTADLSRLAQLHVDTYNETHVGPFGSGPTFQVRQAQWREKLAQLDATNFVFVVETPAGELVGFVWAHPASEGQFAARLNKIYLRRSHQRQGLGKTMMKAAAERLLANGLRSMMLFTETDNEPACRFYESLGGERQVGESGKFGGMYGWPDLRVLLDRVNS